MISIHPRRLKRLLIAAASAVLLGALCFGAIVIEYRTNVLAASLGDWLHDTNDMRPARGGIWERIEARSQAEAGLAQVESVALPEQGLPEAVRENRFEYNRVPQSGPVGYLAVWSEPVEGNSAQRPIHEVLSGYNAFKIGLSLLSAARLPDARYRRAALEEADRIVSGLAAPDSARTPLLEELILDVTNRLRETEHQLLLDKYRRGEVLQIEVQQAVGEFAGSITFKDERPMVHFTVPAENVHSILSPSDGNQTVR